MKLAEIASRIQAHLERFAADPKTATTQNTVGGRLKIYHEPWAWAAGSKLGLRYANVLTDWDRFLTKDEALAYLAWLDAGNVGRHHEQQCAAAFAAMREARGL